MLPRAHAESGQSAYPDFRVVRMVNIVCEVEGLPRPIVLEASVLVSQLNEQQHVQLRARRNAVCHAHVGERVGSEGIGALNHPTHASVTRW